MRSERVLRWCKLASLDWYLLESHLVVLQHFAEGLDRRMIERAWYLSREVWSDQTVQKQAGTSLRNSMSLSQEPEVKDLSGTHRSCRIPACDRTEGG